MNVIEVELFDTNVYGHYFFRYNLNITSRQYNIQLYNEFFSGHEVVGIYLLKYRTNTRVYPDLKTISSLNPELGSILIKNIDKVEIYADRDYMIIGLDDFENIIKPYLKVIRVQQAKKNQKLGE